MNVKKIQSNSNCQLGVAGASKNKANSAFKLSLAKKMATNIITIRNYFCGKTRGKMQLQVATIFAWYSAATYQGSAPTLPRPISSF
jgi:hypothetical protein